MTIQEIIHSLETLADPGLQEVYDNAGLITGNKNEECTGILVTLDVTEAIILEAIDKRCNLIVAHHPVIFKGLKKITGSNYVERTIIKAIKNDIAIYAIHTNLDNVIHGVNSKLAALLKLKNYRVLSEKENTLRKLETFVPDDYAEIVRSALFEAGAGSIGLYDQCSFNLGGTGTFRPLEGSAPFSGKKGERFSGQETRIEVIFPFYLGENVIHNLKKAHPYEEVAYYITTLTNTEKSTGSGMIGELEEACDEMVFLQNLKNILHTKIIRHTRLLNKPIKKVAFCGGAGFFLLPEAIARGADIYITADVKYHEFFDADGRIVLADAGHFETEQFTIELLAEYLQNKFLNFAVLKTDLQTNPVNYLR